MLGRRLGARVRPPEAHSAHPTVGAVLRCPVCAALFWAAQRALDARDTSDSADRKQFA